MTEREPEIAPLLFFFFLAHSCPAKKRKKEEKLCWPPLRHRGVKSRKITFTTEKNFFFGGGEAKSAAGGSRICTSKRRVEGREGKAAESLEVEMEGRPISSLNLSLSLPPPAAVTTSNSWLYRSFSQLPRKFRKFLLLFFFDFCHNVPSPSPFCRYLLVRN